MTDDITEDDVGADAEDGRARSMGIEDMASDRSQNSLESSINDLSPWFASSDEKADEHSPANTTGEPIWGSCLRARKPTARDVRDIVDQMKRNTRNRVASASKR